MQHLFKKIDSPDARARRAPRPAWLAEFVDQVAELFEPFTDMGRVGFECAAGEERWEVGMYLGGTELVGGREDGRLRHIAFQFDLLRLASLFDSVESFAWNVYPDGVDEQGTSIAAISYVAMVGTRGGTPLRLRVFGTAPQEVGPGLRQYSDGSWEAV
jgi:hypothetical protein